MTYLNVIYINIRYIFCVHASLVAQTIKHLPTIWETWLWSLDREDPLEKDMATHFSILAWKILWMEEPGRLQSTESQRVEHDWATKFFFWIHKFMLLAYLLFFMCKTILASQYPSCCHCVDLVSRVGDVPHSEDWNARFLEYVCIQILWQVLYHFLI